MLVIGQPPPQGAVNLADMPLDNLVAAALDICQHHPPGTAVWLGYLEGWMLRPHEEILLRRLLRHCECTIRCAFPVALSPAWQNETRTIYTAHLNGPSSAHNDGGAVHNGGTSGHGLSRPDPSTDRVADQDRKARRPPKGGVQERSNSASRDNSGSSSSGHRVRPQ